MTPLITDIIILIVLFASAVIAFIRGFVKETLTIIGLLGAAGASYVWGGGLEPIFMEWGTSLADGGTSVWGIVPVGIFATVLAYASIFIGFFIVLAVISHFIGKAVQDLGMGPLDRTLGFVFGLGRGLLILGLLNIPLMALMDKADQPTWLKDAKTMVFVERTSELIVNLKPDMDPPSERPPEVIIEQDLMNKINDKNGYKREQRQELNELIEEVQ